MILPQLNIWPVESITLLLYAFNNFGPNIPTFCSFALCISSSKKFLVTIVSLFNKSIYSGNKFANANLILLLFPLQIHNF